MKVSLVSVNRERMPEAVIPLGPATAAAVLREQGHEVRILDLCFEESPGDAVGSHLASWEPELVGISLRNLENNQMIGNRSYLAGAREVVEQVREASAGPILLGGAGYSLFPGELLEALDVSFGLAGEAEGALPELVRCIEQDRVPRHVPGACFRGGGERIVSPPALADDLADGPDPAFDLVDCARYLELGAVIPLEGKRGCDLHCSFCPEGTDRERARLKPVGRTVDEIERAVSQVGSNRLFFTDGVFQFPPDHALALCREIERRALDLRWSAGVNPAGLSRELLAAMRRAGCVGVGLSIDAASEDMLRSYRKGFDIDAIGRAVRDLRAVGLPFALFVLFGGPGETPESVDAALELLERLVPDDMVFLGLGLRIFRGTPLEEMARREGRISPGHDLLAPTYYLSSALDESLLDELEARCAPRQRWLTLPGLLRHSAAEPPESGRR